MIFFGIIGVSLLTFAIFNKEPLWAISGAILLNMVITHLKTESDTKFRLSVLEGISKFLEDLDQKGC
jgi:tellurite resistance-related uncharacterized protein